MFASAVSNPPTSPVKVKWAAPELLAVVLANVEPARPVNVRAPTPPAIVGETVMGAPCRPENAIVYAGVAEPVEEAISAGVAGRITNRLTVMLLVLDPVPFRKLALPYIFPNTV